MPDRVILCIGTKKGLFVAEAAKTRRSFALRGPFGPGVAVYSTLIDTRGTPRLYASSCNPFFGMKVLRLDRPRQEVQGDEVGARPSRRTTAARSPTSGRSKPGDGKKDLLCGVEPASLFRSGDGGDSWEMVPGISNHEHARKWQPGQRRALHAHDPARRQPRAPRHLDRRPLPQRGRRRRPSRPPTRASAPASRPIRIPSSASACTRSRGHKDAPGRLYMQNHGGWAEWDGPGGPRPDIGVLRSDDHGHTWRSIAKGLPSDFGFPIVVHPHDPDTVYVLPLEPMTRTCPGGAPAVWRSENGGDSWKQARQGLAEEGELLHRPARRAWTSTT